MRKSLQVEAACTAICSTPTRRFRSTGTSAQPRGSPKCFCRVTRARSSYCRRYRPPGRMDRLRDCEPAADFKSILRGRAALLKRRWCEVLSEIRVKSGIATKLFNYNSDGARLRHSTFSLSETQPQPHSNADLHTQSRDARSRPRG